MDFFLTFPVPIYRFFDKEHYADSMLSGVIRFNTIEAFNSLEDEKFRDENEGGHTLKIPCGWKREDGSELGPLDPKIITSHTIRRRRLPNAWAFCCSSSTISKAQKPYAVRASTFGLIQQLDYAIIEKFGESLPILCGPVSYYNEESNFNMQHEQPPYFSKLAKFKEDLEFRIVIIPPSSMQTIEPITLKIPDPKMILSKVLIF